MTAKIEPGQGLGRGKGRAPTFDHEEAIELYTEMNWSVARIARHFGKTEMTIYRMFKQRGIELHWTRKRQTCRNGHARLLWGQVSRDNKWRCRRCDRGEVGFVYLVTVADQAAGVFSTHELAEGACPTELVWACVITDTLWQSGEYTIQAFPLDPSRRRKL